MAVRIASSAVITCLGDGAATFEGLLAGRIGVGPLRFIAADQVRVSHGYFVADDGGEAFRASRWLTACVADAVADAAVEPGERVVAIVGTGLRELRAVELDIVRNPDELHFADAVRRASPAIAEVVTVSNACSAGLHALALGQDLLELGECDVAVVAATDTMTASMLAMIGRFNEVPTTAVRPFDRDRVGVLLGEGAAAIVLVDDRRPGPARGRLIATGMSCDAQHETVLAADGVRRALRDALARSGRAADDVDLVVAHGTGTPLNDAVEAQVLREVLGPRPRITALKGSLGHTSGSAGLMSVDVALRALASGRVPPIAGLATPLAEGAGLGFVIGAPVTAPLRLACVEAFGFGGVNAVALVEGP